MLERVKLVWERVAVLDRSKRADDELAGRGGAGKALRINLLQDILDLLLYAVLTYWDARLLFCIDKIGETDTK
ncbi:MAG TPA: hypothetical protein VFS27_05400 [Blastocatellia bacterium]|nr:hypothetical protein [Blastocatellia bacterium]